jgi:hypothetical protein
METENTQGKGTTLVLGGTVPTQPRKGAFPSPISACLRSATRSRQPRKSAWSSFKATLDVLQTNAVSFLAPCAYPPVLEALIPILAPTTEQRSQSLLQNQQGNAKYPSHSYL